MGCTGFEGIVKAASFLRGFEIPNPETLPRKATTPSTLAPESNSRLHHEPLHSLPNFFKLSFRTVGVGKSSYDIPLVLIVYPNPSDPMNTIKIRLKLLNRKPQTPNPKLLNPQRQTLNPKPYINPKWCFCGGSLLGPCSRKPFFRRHSSASMQELRGVPF